MKRLLPCLVVASLAFFTAGCSTTQSRSQEKAAAFDALSPRLQKAALKGEIAGGMTPDAVYIALGHPTRITTGVEKGVPQERWVYTEIESQQIPAWRDVPVRGPNGGYVMTQRYEPIAMDRLRASFEVTFEKGKVVGWRGL